MAPSRVVLGSLFAAAVDLGRALSHADAVDWGGRTLMGSGGVSARGVCDEALHESHHHLGDVEVLLNEVTNPHLPPTSTNMAGNGGRRRRIRA